MQRQVFLYETESGKSPVQQFIKSLKPKEQQKIAWGLKLIQDGFPFTEPYFKKITNVDDLWELRVTFGGNAFRLFYFEWLDKIIVVTNGISKKDSKDQNSGIELAKKFMNEYKGRIS